MNCYVTLIFYRMGLFNDTLSCLDYTESVVCELISEENWWNYVAGEISAYWSNTNHV